MLKAESEIPLSARDGRLDDDLVTFVVMGMPSLYHMTGSSDATLSREHCNLLSISSLGNCWTPG
jgi:hypothetical protein